MDGIDHVHGGCVGRDGLRVVQATEEEQQAERGLQDHATTDHRTGRGEIIMEGGGLRVVQATEEERAAIGQFLKERGAAAPGAAPAVGASALMSAGLRLAGILFVVAGMGGGLGDLVHLHDSWCEPALAGHAAATATATGNTAAVRQTGSRW
jgi:hypothetical protein